MPLIHNNQRYISWDEFELQSDVRISAHVDAYFHENTLITSR
jgi:hypothetical protein